MALKALIINLIAEFVMRGITSPLAGRRRLAKIAKERPIRLRRTVNLLSVGAKALSEELT
ncbi:hypothetical protein ABK905_26530 [Acerihabitans sp. KWT182]|uniref:Uncharacterized protein n=1 Tax=Acerihabitans sp. KWT182 TaxID=3157919 RepID=A0AAU7QC57_9GAMM